MSQLVEQYCLHRPETWLRLSFRSRSKLKWAEHGHEIAWAEIRLDKNERYFKANPIPSLTPPKIDTDDGNLRISGSNVRLDFNPIQARILSWAHRGVEQFCDAQGPKLTFWRAPTDNDKPRAANTWRGWRLHQMTEEVRSVKYQYIKATSQFEIVVQSWVAPKVLGWGFETTTTYTIPSDRTLVIHIKASPKGPTPSILPRVGLEMMLPLDRTVAQWFGLGPGQSYRDMKEAGKVGLWKRDLEDMMFNYDMPQENGNRTETRWVKITDQRGIGLRATLHRENSPCALQSQHARKDSVDSTSSNSPSSSRSGWELVHRPKEHKPKEGSRHRPGFDFAVSKYTAEDLEQAQHPHELRGSKGVNFRIDDDHHGLGTASCGPDTLEQHQLKMRDFDFTVTLEIIGV